MQTSTKLEASNLIKFIITWILITSTLIPITILFLFPALQENVPINISELYKTALIELIVLITAYMIYTLANRSNKSINYKNPPKISKKKLIIPYIFSLIVTIHSIQNIISPAAYTEINEIGSSAVFGGSIALATLYPLFISVIIATTCYILLIDVKRNRLAFGILYSTLIATTISEILSGARIAILYPILPFLLSNILKIGVWHSLKKYILPALITLPLLGTFLILSASLRTGGSTEDIEGGAEITGLFFTHIYLKFSGITNSSFLNSATTSEDYGSTLTALSGSLTTFIPRFLFQEKPISGSLNGLESGLPYRIAANILGYEDYGNVVLSPGLLSHWLGGTPGIIANIFTLSGALILIHILVKRGIKKRSPLHIGLAFYIIGMPHFISFYVDFTQGVSILIRGFIFFIFIEILALIIKPGKSRPNSTESDKNE